MPIWPKKTARPGVDPYGRSTLWHAAAQGDLAGISAAIGRAEDPSGSDDTGFTPLHIASQNSHLEAVLLLIQAAANVNALDKYGNGPLWTATHHACLASATDHSKLIVEALLKAGADPNHLNAHNRSPLLISERSSSVREIFRKAMATNG